MRPSYSTESSLATLASIPVGVNELFHFVILACFHGGEDFKGQGNRRVIQLFGADIYRTTAFAYFHPVLSKTRVREDIHITFFLVAHN